MMSLKIYRRVIADLLRDAASDRQNLLLQEFGTSLGQV